jgi:maleylpyruvate isomerase
MTTEHVDAVAAAHARLLRLVAELDDTTARRASLLPGWSVAHVLTHLARNADSFVWLCDGAAAGEVRVQYPGGPAQREADIAAGADRPAAELVADVRASCARLEAAFATVVDWDAPCRVTAGEVSLRRLPRARRREVEMHSADLGFEGFSWRDWTDGLVDAELADLDADRRRHVVAFLAGRVDVPPPTSH